MERTGDEAGDGVDRVFDGRVMVTSICFDGHDAVVDTDDDAGKVGLGEDGDRDAKSEEDACDREDDGEEKDAAHPARDQKELSEAGVGSVTCRPSSLAASGLASSRVGSGDDFDVGAIVEGGSAGRDDLLARGEAGEDLGQTRIGDAGFHGGLVGNAVGANDHDGGFAGAGDHDGFGGDDDGLGRGAARDGDMDSGRRGGECLWGFRGGPRFRRWYCQDRERADEIDFAGNGVGRPGTATERDRRSSAIVPAAVTDGSSPAGRRYPSR